MKKITLTLLAALFVVAGYTQPFTLTVDGFRDSKDTTKDYVVVQVPDYDKATLFQRTKNYFTVTYNSPQNVMSESGTEVISVLGGEDISYSAGRMGRTPAHFKYKFITEFKDGRVKITPVWIDLRDEVNKYDIQSQGLMLGVYRKNRDLRDEKAKTQIESIINNLVVGLEQALTITTSPTTEDW